MSAVGILVVVGNLSQSVVVAVGFHEIPQVLSRLPASVVDAVLDKTDLAGYFPHRVTGEDEKFDDYRGYMLVSFFGCLGFFLGGGASEVE